MENYRNIRDYIKNLNNERLNWDSYFMSIAYLISKRSPCNRLNVGCVIVRDNRILATGYNGFLPGASHQSIVRDNHEQMTVHSEVNCLLDCAKRGINTNNTIAYVTHYPCLNCYKSLASSGIKTIIYGENYKNDPIIDILNQELNINIIQYN